MSPLIADARVDGHWRVRMLAAGLFLLHGGQAAPRSQVVEPGAAMLAPGQVVERSIGGGDRHTYAVSLAAGQYLDVSIDPHGVTVVFRLSAPGDRAFVEELPGGTGPKSIEWVADEAAPHLLDVRSTSVATLKGDYRIEVRALRDASPADRTRFAARLALDEGESLAGKGRFAKAVESYEAALEVARELGDGALEGRILAKMGVAQRRLGNLEQAGATLQRAFELRRELGPYPRADALLALGGLARDQRDHQLALRHYLEAAALMREARSRANEAVALHNLAALYADLGSYDDAVKALATEVAVLREEGLVENEARALSGLGTVHWRNGDPARALEAHHAAHAIRQRQGNEPRMAEVLVDLGLTYQSLAEADAQPRYLDTAIAHLEQALGIHTRLNNDAGRRVALQGLRRTYVNRGELDKALACSEQVLALPGGADWPEYLARARIELKRGRLPEAREWSDKALTALESSRPRIADDYLRASYEGSVNHLFDLQVDILMRLHEQDPQRGLDRAAFRASERGRARALLDSLGDARAGSAAATADPGLLKREQELGASAATLRARLAASARGSDPSAALETELRRTLTELDQTRNRIRRGRRHEAMVRVEPPDLAAIQSLLDDKSLVLEYDLGLDRSYLWAITKRSWASFVLPSEHEIEAVARRLPELLSRRATADLRAGAAAVRSRLAAADREYAAQSSRLSDMILGPLRPGPELSRLILVCDGALHYVPLAGLPLPASWRGAHAADAGLPLISRFELIALPSVSMIDALERERQSREPPRKRLAIFADPVFGPGDARLRAAGGGALPATPGAPAERGRVPADGEGEQAALRLGTMSGGAELSRLAYTAQLADRLLKDVPSGQGLAAVGFDANREEALRPALADYRILVFATHGLLDAEFPALSGIVLSTVDPAGLPRNGVLRQHDVQAMSLNADLVVLAGCQTGLGKEIRGEGLLGLSRAFFYAGASRVVASLWKVEEQATVRLITDFLRLVAEGKSYSAALRDAQLSLARDPRRRAPYYWAGFVLQGDWR